mgnify:FL=1
METVITEEEKGILRLPPVGKILSESVTLYRMHARTIAGIGVLPALLGAMSILLLAGGSTIPSTILLVVAVIVGMFARFAWAASVTSETVLNAGVGAAYRAVFANIRSVAWISILTGLVILGGLVLLVIPGIIVAVKLNFALYAFFIEKKRGSDALATSWYYARNSFWPIVWRLVCLGLILSFIGILVSIVGYLVSQVVPFGGETADFSMVLLRDSQQEISVISQFFQFAFNYFV